MIPDFFPKVKRENGGFLKIFQRSCGDGARGAKAPVNNFSGTPQAEFVKNAVDSGEANLYNMNIPINLQKTYVN